VFPPGVYPEAFVFTYSTFPHALYVTFLDGGRPRADTSARSVSSPGYNVTRARLLTVERPVTPLRLLREERLSRWQVDITRVAGRAAVPETLR
jgi:hypothetical protein